MRALPHRPVAQQRLLHISGMESLENAFKTLRDFDWLLFREGHKRAAHTQGLCKKTPGRSLDPAKLRGSQPWDSKGWSLPWGQDEAPGTGHPAGTAPSSLPHADISLPRRLSCRAGGCTCCSWHRGRAAPAPCVARSWGVTMAVAAEIGNHGLEKLRA